MKKGTVILYICLFLAVCLLPSAGLLAGGGGEPTGQEEQSSLPAMRLEDGSLNTEYLSMAGAWFEEHFAWRQELVTANAELQARLFRASAEDGVILGTDGWLYYRDSLDDYTGRNQLSDRALYDIAHTAGMVREYCSYMGIGYLFALAPDKATVYPEHMARYYACKVSDTSNRTRLKAFMEAEGVDYLDLGEVLTEEADRRREDPGCGILPALYHKEDSHWTNEGAAIAADVILDRLGREHRDYSQAAYTVRRDFAGDLAAMLYPAEDRREEEVCYDPEPSYEYVQEVESTFDYFISTRSGSGSGSLVMYRDSFCNALLPFLAEAFGQGYFSRGVPANLLFDMSTCAADTVITEHAERNLPDAAETPPVLQALPSAFSAQEEEMTEADASLSVSTEEANPYFTRIRGTLDETPEAGTRICVDPGDGVLYEAMPLHLQEPDEEGFVLYLPADSFPPEKVPEDGIRVRLYREPEN